MSKLPDRALIEFKLSLIRKELEDTDPLFKVIHIRDPDAIEIRAAGSIFQSVYNGFETIFEALAAERVSSVGGGSL